jgi:hypothetical protein
LHNTWDLVYVIQLVLVCGRAGDDGEDYTYFGVFPETLS